MFTYPVSVLSQTIYNFDVFQGREKHSGFLNEAKEWAGELLSGQTRVRGITIILTFKTRPIQLILKSIWMLFKTSLISESEFWNILEYLAGTV